jgi:hypothetical protein
MSQQTKEKPMGIEGIDNLSGTDTVHEVDQPSETTAEVEARHESELEAERRKHQEMRNTGLDQRADLQRQVIETTPQTAGPVTE